MPGRGRRAWGGDWIRKRGPARDPQPIPEPLKPLEIKLPVLCQACGSTTGGHAYDCPVALAAVGVKPPRKPS